MIQDYLTQEVAAFPGKTALLMVDLEDGGVRHAVNADAQVPAASTIKLPILLAGLHLVEGGKFALDQVLPIPPEAILPDTEVFEHGEKSCTLREALYWMIVKSDNTATNLLINTFGYQAVNDYMLESLGMTQSILARHMLDADAASAGRDNLTTAADQYSAYRRLYDGAILTEPLRAVAWDILTRQRSMDAFLRYISDPVTVAHKTGGLDGVAHDAGIFICPNVRYYLGIFTWDGPSLEGDPRQKQYIGRLSRAIYDIYAGGAQ